MESGNSISGSNAPAPTTPEANKDNDWRNNALVVKAQTTPNTPNAPRERGGSAGAIGLACFSLLVGCFGIILAIAAISKTSNLTQNGSNNTTSANGYYNGNSVEFEQTSIAAIVEKVTPAVVSIITSSTQTGGSRWSGQYSYDVQSAGTGMIVSSDGYILTNKHVVEGGHAFQVTTSEGEAYDNVTLVAEDPLNDVAYLKINGVSDLPTVTLGDSKTIAVGQPVLAIGNAQGLYQNTVTQGIISGTGRSLDAGDSDGGNLETLTDMLQTDAAINPGNSGGPLVNANGDVIGINTAVSTEGQGIGFAIPISATLGMLHNITDNGETGRAYVGVSYTQITPEMAKAENLSSKTGALVKAVVANGPGAAAGIKERDIITKVNGTAIGRAGSVATLIGEYKPGETVELTILRGGEELTINVTLAAYSE